MNIHKAASIMGKKGGVSGTGKRKNRGHEHYSRISKLAWKYRGKPLADRFWIKVQKKSPDECWNWTGFINMCGYGRFRIESKMYSAHRIAYQLSYGVKAKNHVLHRCDNPACCNPNHLFDGTHKDNMMDRDKKGRQARNIGTLNGNRKLTETDIIKIRSDERPYRTIAHEYGIHYSNVGDIKTRRTWKHVP